MKEERDADYWQRRCLSAEHALEIEQRRFMEMVDRLTDPLVQKKILQPPPTIILTSAPAYNSPNIEPKE